MHSSGQRLKDLNYLRAFGVFFVILIHTSSHYATLPASSLTYNIWGSINNLALPAVPLFLFISALTLTYSSVRKQSGGAKFSTLSFYQRRLDKILLPFLCWTAIYLIFRHIIGSGFPTEPLALLKEIIKGKGYYHLYYIIIALQLYLLFPLIMLFRKSIARFFDNAADRHKLIFAFLLAVCAYFIMLFTYKVVWPIYHSTASTLFPYALPVVCGIYFGFDIRRLDHILNNCKWLVVSGFVIFGALSVLQGIFSLFVINTSFVMLIRMIYAVFTALFFLLVCRMIREDSIVSRILIPISEFSFFIYLSHPLFQTVGENFLHLRDFIATPWLLVNFSADTLISFMFCLLCSLCLAYICRKLKLQRFLG